MKLAMALPIWIVAAVTIFSCESESDTKGSFSDLSDEAKNFLRISQNNAAAQDGLNVGFRIGTPMNNSFEGLYNMSRGMNGARVADDSSKTQPDTTVFNDPMPWISCDYTTTTVNEDGSVTTTHDYGDGCWEGSSNFKTWTMGKYSYTYLNSYTQDGSAIKDSYYYTNTFDNYGGKYYSDNDSSVWLDNGTSHSQGESTYDTTAQIFSGHYNSDYDFTYSLNSMNYAYSGSGKYVYSTSDYIVEKNSYSYSDGINYYDTKVIEPLVMRFDCNKQPGGQIPVDYTYCWTYVSGKEVVHYKQDGKEGTFEIDYGNGSCDNIITVIEDNKRVDINLGELTLLLQ